MGAKLKSAEFIRQVELARSLLALVGTLQVGKILEQPDFFPAPRFGWQQRLQELRLFGAIKPLEEALASLSGTSEISKPAAVISPAPKLVAKSLF